MNASMAGFAMDRGTGCSLHDMGHAAESHHFGHTNLYYGKQSQRFYNDELNKTYPGAPQNLYDLSQYTVSGRNFLLSVVINTLISTLRIAPCLWQRSSQRLAGS